MSEPRVHRSARWLASSSIPTRTSLGRLTRALPDAMAPKVDASRDAPLTEVRPQDFDDIARWLSAVRQITHSGGLRHAFARLDVNDILRLEQECSIWHSRMMPPPVVALTPSRSLTPNQPKAKAPPTGFELDGPYVGGPPAALLDVVSILSACLYSHADLIGDWLPDALNTTVTTDC